MKIDYKTNYKGYISFLRALFLLIHNKTLTMTQLAHYLGFITQADFFPLHKNYRIIIRDDKELAKEWKMNKATVYKNRKLLIRKGLLIEKNGYTFVPNFYMFELKMVQTLAGLPPELLQTFFTKSQKEIEKNPEVIALMQTKRDQNTTQSFNVSSKGDSSFSEEDEEYINTTLPNVEGEENDE